MPLLQWEIANYNEFWVFNPKKGSKHLLGKPVKKDNKKGKSTLLNLMGEKKAYLYANNLKKKISWTSSHPIAGSEKNGLEYGKQNLFEKKWCVLIKTKKCNLKHLKIIIHFYV